MKRPIQWKTDSIYDRLQSARHDRTLVGGISVSLFFIGGYILGGPPALIVGGVVALLWIFGTSPLAIAIGSIGLTAITDPPMVSTVFGATPTIFPTPLIGVFLVGAGIAGLCLEPLVTAQRPTRVVVAAGLFVVACFASLLVVGQVEEVPVFNTAAIAAVGVLFFAGVIARTVTVWTPSQEAVDE